MTKKARALGMQRTTFKNASGLPDAEQVTTAREFAILGRAIQDRFPRHYRYFAIKSFEWQGVGIRNHNKLLGKIDGLDGIKTGYTRASGFNLVSSVRVNERHVVAVVLGGNTAAARDARMRELIRTNLARASTGARTAPRIVEAPEATPARPVRIASTVPVEIPPISATAPSPGSEEPIRPTPVKTFVVGKSGEPASPGAAKPGTLGVVPSTSLSLMTPAGAVIQQWTVGPQPAAERQVLVVARGSPLRRPPKRPPRLRPLQLPPLHRPHRPLWPSSRPPRAAVSAPPAPAIPTRAPANVRGGWLIQVGAFPDERQARERLDATRGKLSALLAKAAPYTEKTVKGSNTSVPRAFRRSRRGRRPARLRDAEEERHRLHGDEKLTGNDRVEWRRQHVREVRSSTMATKQNILGLVDAGREVVGAPLVGVELLHQRPVRPADLEVLGSRFKPQDLVRLFLGHRAMARRLSAPRTRIFLDVFTPSGVPAVQISFE